MWCHVFPQLNKKMENQKYIYVYQTICETNGKSYIGIHSTDDLNDGYIGCGVYMQSDARKNSYLFHKAVRKYGYNSFKKHVLSFYDTYEEALQEEKYLVDKKWVKKDDNYNTALGGRGSTSFAMDEGAKKQWKKNISEGVRKWVSNGGYDILVNNVRNPDRKKSVRKKGYKVYSNRRRVIQYDLDGYVVKIHGGVNEAGEILNTNAGNIVSCCKGDYKTCVGFIFRYENYSEKELISLTKKISRFDESPACWRKIKAYNIINGTTKEYNSLNEASRKLGVSVAGIRLVLNGKTEKCKNYHFKYSN